jgi:hypothetical protein
MTLRALPRVEAYAAGTGSLVRRPGKPVRRILKGGAAPDRIGLHRPRSHTLELSLVHSPDPLPDPLH